MDAAKVRKLKLTNVILIVIVCLLTIAGCLSSLAFSSVTKDYKSTITSDAHIFKIHTSIAHLTQTEIARPTETFTPSATFTNTFTPTITNTSTSIYSPTITLTPSRTPTRTRTSTPSRTPTPTIKVIAIYYSFKNGTSLQFSNYLSSIIGQTVKDQVTIGNVSENGVLNLYGPWSPELFNWSDFCVVVNNVPKDTAIKFYGGQVINLEATVLS